MTIQNYDEVDFTDQASTSAGFMHLGLSEDGGVAIEIAIIDNGRLDLIVTIEDARRLGGRLVAAANAIAAEH